MQQNFVKINDIFNYYNIENENISIKIDKIKVILNNLSSVSSFEDSKWILNLQKKAKNMSISTYTIYFSNIPEKQMVIVKIHTLLVSLSSVTRAIDFPTKILHHIKFCNDNNIPLSKFNIKHFQLYEKYLQVLEKDDGMTYHPDTLFKIWDASKFFLSTLTWFPSHPYLKNLKDRSFPLSRISENQRNSIDNHILYELDSAINQEYVSLHFKTAYWFARLFPLRINEILNLNIDCYKRINNDFILLSFPDIKTNGGYSIPAYRTELLYLRDKHQQYLFKLLKEQIRVSIELQDLIEEKKLLFTYKGINNGNKNVYLLTRDYFGILFRKIQKRIGLKKYITVHQLRTTGATLRAEHGFTSVQLKELLNVNLNTVSSYSKISNNKLIGIQNKIVKNDMKPKAFFNGKIINSTNSFIENQIIKNPLAHKLPDMGYCSYENKCGNHFDCLECEYLIPDVSLLEYYRKTALNQLEKSEFWTKKSNDIYRRDNLHRATLFTKLYEKALIAKGE